MKKKVVSGMLVLSMTFSVLAGGGMSASASEGEEKYPEFLTIDVFDSVSNYQGLQSGWFAELVKEKFNMELNLISPNVAGGCDTLYQTRSANGNLGDVIITKLDNSRLKDLVEDNFASIEKKAFRNISSEEQAAFMETFSKIYENLMNKGDTTHE